MLLESGCSEANIAVLVGAVFLVQEFLTHRMFVTDELCYFLT